jgi:hypothetical protein
MRVLVILHSFFFSLLFFLSFGVLFGAIGGCLSSPRFVSVHARPPTTCPGFFPSAPQNIPHNRVRYILMRILRGFAVRLILWWDSGEKSHNKIYGGIA